MLTKPHVPHGRPLWSLMENVVVDDGSRRDTVTVRGNWGRIDLTDGSRLVRDALRRMSLGPVSLQNIPELYENFLRWQGNRDADCPEWRQLQRVLDRLGGNVVPSLGHDDGAGPILSVVAAVPAMRFRLPPLDAGRPLRARPGSVIDRRATTLVLACPGWPYRVLLHRPPAPAVAGRLTARASTLADLPRDLAVDPPVVADVVAYLMGAGLVESG